MRFSASMLASLALLAPDAALALEQDVLQGDLTPLAVRISAGDTAAATTPLPTVNPELLARIETLRQREVAGTLALEMGALWLLASSTLGASPSRERVAPLLNDLPEEGTRPEELEAVRKSLLAPPLPEPAVALGAVAVASAGVSIFFALKQDPGWSGLPASATRDTDVAIMIASGVVAGVTFAGAGACYFLGPGKRDAKPAAQRFVVMPWFRSGGAGLAFSARF